MNLFDLPLSELKTYKPIQTKEADFDAFWESRVTESTHHGYFKKEDEKDIIDKINKSGANILLVALGAPKQELWIEEYKQDLQHVRVAIGVGGSFDVMAEAVKRAPVFFQKCGLEWFYRLIKQPSRAKRMLLIPKFIVKVARQRKDNMK
jgi:N-acetylglucosaminyldiphosphoundecaprenol N-acetyl-beta-D-mannosaminyltransferase